MTFHYTDADGEQLHIHAGRVDAATGQPLPSSDPGITVTAQDRDTGTYVPVFIPLARVDELLAGARDCARQSTTPAAPAKETQADDVWTVKDSTRHYAEKLRLAPGQASADGHTGWECDAGAQLLVSATTPGPGALGTHHGTIYACPNHQAPAVDRITDAGYEADPRPAPPGHRWNPWPCGHVTAHGGEPLAGLTAGTQSETRADGPAAPAAPVPGEETARTRLAHDAGVRQALDDAKGHPQP